MKDFDNYVILNTHDNEDNKVQVALIKVSNGIIIDKFSLSPKIKIAQNDITKIKKFIDNSLLVSSDIKLVKKLNILNDKFVYPAFDTAWAFERFENKMQSIYQSISKEWEDTDDIEIYIGCYLKFQDVEIYKYICNNAKI